MQRRWRGDDRGRRRGGGDGGTDEPDTEAEVDAVQRKNSPPQSLSSPLQSANTHEIQIHITPIRSSSPPIRMVLLLPDAYSVKLPLCYSSGRCEASSSGSVAKMKA
ncbi:hypothetical protein F2Q69_00020978 [Brassica cretica]|uniref:Uncharacterized protein n=1 Tax=Brassica cretica TaxID=69181 RepID=A0A8S9QBX2_BRACR|nr:hypothetical protein F2Q69_00020978 [Brassica cretica]